MWLFFGFRGFGRGHSCSNWLWLGRCGGFILCRSGNRFGCHFSFRRSGLFVFGARNAFGFGFGFRFGCGATRFCIVFCGCCDFGYLSHFNHRFGSFHHWRRRWCHCGFNHRFRRSHFAGAIINLDAATTTGLHLHGACSGFH